MKIVAQTKHYQIEDAGRDFNSRFRKRFSLHRKPEFSRSRVPVCFSYASADSADLLMEALNESERFHTSNAYCGQEAR